MSDRDDNIIQPQTAPLSHLASAKAKSRQQSLLDWRSATVAVAVVLVVGLAVWWQPEAPVTVAPERGESVASPTSPPAASPQTDDLAPFARAQHQLTREKAQDALAQFVERQIELEDNMQVASWGAEGLAEAMALAQTGDERFLKEDFEVALESYSQAADRMQSLIAEGERLYGQRVDNGLAAVADFDPDAAVREIEAALVIKPEGPEAIAGLARARTLPEIIGKLRTAKNHELGGRFDEAVALYDEVAQLDPQTTGLAELRAGVARQRAGDSLNAYISRGFSALNEKRFEAARSAFNAALKLDPGNDIAAGGLQQVAEQNDLAIIRSYEQKGKAAMAAEAWQEAADAYAAALELDSNIQFASSGRSAALAHQRVQRLLNRIIDAPGKLSSQKLYLDAEAILAEANALEFAGPKLQASATEVGELLALYRDPVEVTLVSDNATDVIMSNVGKLGAFERKTLTLRPGEYTIRGSQDGCRDVVRKVEVLPGIQPIDVRCAETLARQ